MMLITSWQQYDIAYAFAKIGGTSGNGPSNSLLLPTYHIYSTAFKTLDIGYAAAMSWLLALLAMTLAFINTKFSRMWVTYER